MNSEKKKWKSNSKNNMKKQKRKTKKQNKKIENEKKMNIYKPCGDTPLNIGFDRVPIQKNIDFQMVLWTHPIALSHFTSPWQTKKYYGG